MCSCVINHYQPRAWDTFLKQVFQLARQNYVFEIPNSSPRECIWNCFLLSLTTGSHYCNEWQLMVQNLRNIFPPNPSYLKAFNWTCWGLNQGPATWKAHAVSISLGSPSTPSPILDCCERTEMLEMEDHSPSCRSSQSPGPQIPPGSWTQPSWLYSWPEISQQKMPRRTPWFYW